MKCLVVTAHPLNNSLCKTLTHEIINRLEKAGHEVVATN